MKFSPKSIRRHKKEDPYSYLVDNLPIADLLAACVTLQYQINSAPNINDYTLTSEVDNERLGKIAYESRRLEDIADVNSDGSPSPEDVLVYDTTLGYTPVDHKASQLHEFLDTVADLSPISRTGEYLNFDSNGDLSSVNINPVVNIKDFVDSRYDSEGTNAQNPPWQNDGAIWVPPPSYRDYVKNWYVAYNRSNGNANTDGKNFYGVPIGTTTNQTQYQLIDPSQWIDRLQAVGGMQISTTAGTSQHMIRESDITGGTVGGTNLITPSEWATSAGMFDPTFLRDFTKVISAGDNKKDGEYIFPDGFVIKWESGGSIAWNYHAGTADHHWGGTPMTHIFMAIVCLAGPGNTHVDRVCFMDEFYTDLCRWGVASLGSSLDSNVKAKFICLGRVAKTW